MCDSHCPTFWHVATLESLKTSGAPWFEKKKNTAAAPPGRLKATLLASDAVWLRLASEFRWILKESPFLIRNPHPQMPFCQRSWIWPREFGHWKKQWSMLEAFCTTYHLGCSQVLSNGESKCFAATTSLRTRSQSRFTLCANNSVYKGFPKSVRTKKRGWKKKWRYHATPSTLLGWGAGAW